MANNENTNPGDLIFGFFAEISMIESLARTGMEKVLPKGMKSSHFNVLNHLVRLGKKETPAQLAVAFQVSRPSMTNTIQKLEAKKYITVQPNLEDGRGKYVLITQEGKLMRNEAISALQNLFGDLVKKIGANAFSSTLPALKKIRNHMDSNRI